MFTCNHCGRCCTDPAAQIALTVGDLVRISKHLKTSISSLFGRYVDFTPFRGENPTIYDYELGLIIPCKFRQKQRCVIYSARDLNSRLFPFWMITAPDNVVDPDFGCLKQLKKLKGKETYLKYKKRIGKILLKESELTDKIIKRLNAKRHIDLRFYDEYFKLLEQCNDSHEIEVKKVRLAMRLRGNQFFKKLPSLIEKEIKNNNKLINIIKVNNQKLIEIEQSIKWK